MKTFLLFIFSLFLIHTANSQEQISNTSYKDGDEGSTPKGIVKFNGHLFFTAFTRSYGREIWVSTGEPNEATLLKDIMPGGGTSVGYNFNESAVVLNNKLYFIARDGLSNGEIWCTDGTREGTEKVTHSLNKNIEKLTLVGNKIYFLINTNNLLQVWQSDGTEAGTQIVREDIGIWNTPSYQGKYNSLFIFTFQPYGINTSRVWRSDGTHDGTFAVTDPMYGNGAGPSGSSDLTQYIEFNNELYFVNWYHIYKTDGTKENTQTVFEFDNSSHKKIDYADVIEINGKLYFLFFEVDGKRLFIWETDGTELGSRKIYDESGDRYFMTSNLAQSGGDLVFCGKNATGGTSPIKFDLQSYTTTYLDEIEETTTPPWIFSNDSDFCLIRQVGEQGLFITSPTDSRKRKGWMTDFAEGTITNIENLNDVSDIILLGDLFYFSKTGVDQGRELWKSDGTNENTVVCDNINKSKYGLRYTYWATTNSSLYFNGSDNNIGFEPWVYKEGETRILKDIKPGEIGSYPEYFTNLNDRVFFTAMDDTHGNELWKSDGTSEGTQLVSDIVEGDDSSDPHLLKLFKTDLYFIVTKENHQHLCKTNGLSVEFIKDIGVNTNGVALSVKEMISTEGYLYFVTEAAGEDLWRSDGTESGTQKVKDFYTCSQLTDVNGKLFFTAYEAYKGELELWSSDGTEAGTLLVKDIGTGYASQPNELYAFNNSLYFSAYTEDDGREIWQSNGTEVGTTQLTDINLGSKSSIIYARFCSLGNYLYFNADNGTNGFELWKTDGTELGTVLAKDINPGIASSQPSYMLAIQNLLYFQAFDNEHGAELWKYDPLENDAELLVDLYPGIESSNPTDISSVGDDVFFIAESSNTGRQFWKMAYNEQGCIPAAEPTPVVGNLPNLTGECSVEIDTAPTATDDCGNTLTGTSTDSQSYTEQGIYTLTWTYEDSRGNTSSQEQTVIVDDVTIPILSLKEGVDNKTINLDANQTQYTVVGNEFDPLEATDNCGVASVRNDFNNLSSLEGARLPGGRTTISWTVTDIAENIETLSFDVIVNVTVGIEDVNENEILLYPNPTSSYVNLRVDDIENSSFSYQLYSIKGDLIESKNIHENLTTIPMEHLVSSAYFIKLIRDKKEVKSFKIIKN